MFAISASFLLSTPTSTSASSSLTSFPHLDIVSREEAESSVSLSDPPTLINHLNIGYDVVGVEANLIVSLRLVVVEVFDRCFCVHLWRQHRAVAEFMKESETQEAIEAGQS